MNQPSILIVEDDLEIRKMLTWILETEGYSIATAEDGMDGLAMVEEFQPDLVMLDRYMPLLDGTGFARQLLERGVSVPILAMTASRGTEWPEQIGAIASIAKPFDLDELLPLIARLTADQAASAAKPPEPQ